jgi:hypothetical protein
MKAMPSRTLIPGGTAECDLAGYRPGHTSGGPSDAAFPMVPPLEAGNAAAWPGAF